MSTDTEFDKKPQLIEGVDFYMEGPYFVWTEHYLRERGFCCESGCRHCPYGFGPEGLKRKLAKGD